MKKDNQHKWTEVIPEGKYPMSVVRIHNCENCGCRRETAFSRGRSSYSYTRSGLGLSARPDCFGSVPINEQTID